MRHGEAAEARTDPERPLTPRGLAQAKASAAGLQRLGVQVPVIHHSPYVRAAQTAAAVAAVFGSRLIADDAFLPSSSPEAAAEALIKYGETYGEKMRAGAFVVAHLPILPGIADVLCGARLSFSTAAIAQIVVLGGTGVLGGLWSSEVLERVR